MPRVTRLVWDEDVIEKLERKHGLTTREVEEACFNPSRLVLKGPKRWKKRRYLVYSQTDAGRYILVVLEPLARGEARVITARDLKEKEKRFYKGRRKRR
ncbi:MAG TPA: BrnT family toxin [Candidatus Latescibacteria bacterium]|nr:BrnT family toxin [Candidatus Latescibacterota bacterium]